MSPKTKSVKPVRKHVTTACIPCRDGKVKCDGAKPSCKNCESKNRTCCYRQRDDKRKIPIRVAVTLLAERVASLSQHIRDSGLKAPEMDKRDQDTLRNILQSLGISCEEVLTEPHISSKLGTVASENEMSDNDSCCLPNTQVGMMNPESSYVIGCHDERNSVRNEMSAFPQPPVLQTAVEDALGDTVLVDYNPTNLIPMDGTQNKGTLNQLPGIFTAHEHEPPQLVPNEMIAGDLSEVDSDDEVTNQLSCRLGRLQLTHDGQLRYFGSTSNLTLLDALVSVAHPSPNSVQRDTQETLENLNLNMEVEEAFEKHLLKLFFVWQDPCLHVVEHEAFWKAKMQNRYDGSTSPYYSHSLCDAMCAMGAAYEPKYHPDLITFPRSLSEFFGDRAKTLLESEIENPSLATIQALVVLSNYEASSTRDTRGWLYSGMAMRLAFDLGLHLDMTPYVEKGIITTEECKVRQTIFWGSYLNEQFWGYYLGRSLRSPVAGVTVRKPCWSGCHSTTRWRAYGCAQISIQSIPNPLEMICHQWVSLYDLMLPVMDVLYGCLEVSKNALQELTADTVARLVNWKNNLPENLNVDATKESQQYLPHVLTLHMQYYQFMIHCHRPYISKHYIQPQPPQGPGPAHARQMCLESAISIVKVLLMYEQRYGFRKANVQIVSFVFSAALILIFTTVPGGNNKQDDELIKHLSACFWALDDMGGCFENAKRTSTFLSTLQQQWHRRRRNVKERGSKRAQPDPMHSNQGQKKRQNGIAMQGWPEYNYTNSSAKAARATEMDSPNGYETQDFSLVGDNPSDLVDFMDPDLCNILLSEGIPRELV